MPLSYVFSSPALDATLIKGVCIILFTIRLKRERKISYFNMVNFNSLEFPVIKIAIHWLLVLRFSLLPLIARVIFLSSKTFFFCMKVVAIFHKNKGCFDLLGV